MNKTELYQIRGYIYIMLLLVGAGLMIYGNSLGFFLYGAVLVAIFIETIFNRRPKT